MNLIVADGGNRDGTYGSYRIFKDDGTGISWDSYYWGIGDHNYAEYLSVLYALNTAIDLGCKDIIIFTDSETVAEQVRGDRPLHNQRLNRLLKLVKQKLTKFKKWDIIWVDRLVIKALLGH